MPFSKQPDQLPPTDEAQELRSIIDLGSIKTDEDSIPKIENPIYLASYNWLSRGQKTILIPGKLSHSLCQFNLTFSRLSTKMVTSS